MRRNSLTRKRKDCGAMLVIDGCDVGASGFVGITRTEEEEIRDRTAHHVFLNRLMGRTVFTDTNGIVCHDVQDANPLRREAFT